MPADLRAFISSTMEDLGNERRAVVARLTQLGIGPVNAEALPPDGSSSWRLLEEEIKSCQLFILISGRSYGWVPPAGPAGDGKRSVTHMETDAARENGLIILPFFMTLKHGEKRTRDARARDAFRKDIERWDGGIFRKMFSWADELADVVADSVSTVLNQALRRELQARSAAQASMQQASPKRASLRRAALTEAPPATDLHSIIASAPWVRPQAVLMAGAGMSLAAGYPSAPALMQSFLEEMGIGAREADKITRRGFTEAAGMFEKRFERKALLDRISAALLHSDAFGPTRAHIAAVRVFSTIVTTNFDLLFEAACRALGVPCTVATPSDAAKFAEPRQGVMIFKVDGTIERPQSLVLTRQDVDAAAGAKRFWDSIGKRLKGNPLIVVGHALREAAARRVPEAGLHDGGAYVTPFQSAPEARKMFDQYELTGVLADADSFMIAYEQAIASRKQ